MNRGLSHELLAFALLALLATAPSSGAEPATAAEAEVAATVDRFHDALRSLDRCRVADRARALVVGIDASCILF